jgi:transposase-like protein
MDEQPIPETMLQAVRQFADPQVAHDFFVQIRWPNGVACPREGCGNADVAHMAKHRRWYCRECKRQFTAKIGTLFEDSPIGFEKWLPAIWLIASNRNGISSYEIARGLGVTQKTAWFMLHRIREGMRSDSFREVDETYIGGKIKSKPRHVRRAIHEGKMVDRKTPVFGMLERGGDVRAVSLPDPAARLVRVLPKMRAAIHHDATVYTDAAQLYTHINEYFLTHASVNNSADEYVRGDVHTNTIEAFWPVLKRTLGGTYISVRPHHLDRYLDAQICRYNARKENDGPRFAAVVKRADGRRLTWKALTDKTTC